MPVQTPKPISHQDVEKVYWDLLSLAEQIELTPWSKGVPDKDFRRIQQVENRLRQIANDLFLSSHTVEGES